MSGSPTLQERIDSADEEFKGLLLRLKNPSATLDEFCRLIREMTLLKFLLTEEEVTTDELLELSKISVDKLLYLHDKSVQLGHASVSCTGISSTATKKVLLILKLQRELGLQPMPADEAYNLKPTRALGENLYFRLRENGESES